MKLSILIPTLNEPDRVEFLRRLRSVLDPQLTNDVEVCINDAGRFMSTGQKRNELIKNSTGDYFVFLDDDDMISSDYVSEILDAITRKPDVVTFQGWMTTNGASRVDFIIRLGEKYEERDGKYYRFPNHLCAFKRSLVDKIKFPLQTHGEDYIWAKKINDHKLLKTEVHIPKQLYHYQFRYVEPVRRRMKYGV